MRVNCQIYVMSLAVSCQASTFREFRLIGLFTQTLKQVFCDLNVRYCFELLEFSLDLSFSAFVVKGCVSFFIDNEYVISIAF